MRLVCICLQLEILNISSNFSIIFEEVGERLSYSSQQTLKTKSFMQKYQELLSTVNFMECLTVDDICKIALLNKNKHKFVHVSCEGAHSPSILCTFMWIICISLWFLILKIKEPYYEVAWKVITLQRFHQPSGANRDQTRSNRAKQVQTLSVFSYWLSLFPYPLIP